MPQFTRERAVCMLRIRNEEAYVHSALRSSCAVVQDVWILDDHSTDRTEQVCSAGCSLHTTTSSGWVGLHGETGARVHFVRSPFHAQEDEARDKDFLWSLILAEYHPTWVLALDGDEEMSSAAIQFLLHSGEDLPLIGALPFIYLWDSVLTRRVDGIYGDLPDGYPRLRFPRLLHTDDLSDMTLAHARFKRTERGPNLHCGSLPQIQGVGPALLVPAPILHYGYLEAEQRTKKYQWYNTVDPGNQAEGEYRHIIGLPNIHAPGPIQLKAV